MTNANNSLIVRGKENDNVYVIPYNLDNIAPGKQYIAKAFGNLYPNNRCNLFYRFQLAKEILKVVKEENVDIIHFVSADEYLKLFGMSLRILRKYKIVLTFHWCPKSFLRNISRKLISLKVDYMIFHTSNYPNVNANMYLSHTPGK